ncbi:MAG: ABC transporter ATP-binding protein [Leptolyngbyaceae bacterium]|nr:ABC transporter ATP-binding protein [Leptolyngbyaceae bacterium]
MLKSLKKLIFPVRFRTPVLKLILETLRENLWLLLGNLMCSLLAAIFEGGTFGILALALNTLSGNQIPNIQGRFGPLGNLLNEQLQLLNQSQVFIGLIALAVILQALRSGLTYLGTVFSTYLGTSIQERIQQRIYQLIMSFSFPCASRYKVGDLVNYVTIPPNSIVQLTNQLNAFTVTILTSLIYFFLLVSISIPLTIFAFFLFGTLLLFQKSLFRKIRQTAQKSGLASAELTKHMVESIQALRVVHIFQRQSVTTTKIRGLTKTLIDLNRRTALLVGRITPINEVLSIAAVGVFMILGFFTFQNQSSSLPQLLTFIVVLNRLSVRANVASSTTAEMSKQLGIAARLEEILAVHDKEFVREGGRFFEGFHEHISFDKVSMSYGDGASYALKDISFKLRKGTTTALVGGSGAGKSTVVDLLLQLYEPTSGSIYVDNELLSEFSLESWRNHIGVVSQDTFLFNESIFDNIRYGLLEATPEQVIVAAKMAQADDFISNLPDGYNTLIGERGYRLSGGQRQRLALARVIIRQPEILILDEATSALDSQSEKLVQEVLSQFQKQRTVLVVAHRLSTIVNADLIIVLDKGSIVEQGTHKELLEKHGKYYSYWKLLNSGNFGRTVEKMQSNFNIHE